MMSDGTDCSLFGLGARHQVWSDCQARSRVSGVQTGFTIVKYLIHSARQTRKDSGYDRYIPIEEEMKMK